MTNVADKPFDKFAKSNTSVLYLHQFIYSFLEVLSRVTGDLSDTMFSELNGGSQVKKAGKKGRGGKAGQDKVQREYCI